VKTLVEDEELRHLRAMAEGTKPFESSGLWDKLSALDWSEINKILLCLCLLSCAACARREVVPQAPPQPTPVQYEYKILSTRGNHRLRRDPTTVINEMSAEGWEFMGSADSDGRTSYNFRRKKPDGPVESPTQ
jgi:hypothetical protein